MLQGLAEHAPGVFSIAERFHDVLRRAILARSPMLFSFSSPSNGGARSRGGGEAADAHLECTWDDTATRYPNREPDRAVTRDAPSAAAPARLAVGAP
ncbi:hypothetical protein Agsp01_17510 [Agromyces sp. NBRC 114283]|nr:hypothetical protein Agsp01_17510 [Agromyces sp. NBRC 114283]